MIKKNRYWIRVLGVSACVLFMGGGRIGYAHKVNVFAWVDGKRIHTESKFHGGRPAKEAPLEVLDLNGERLLEGKTDDQGLFSFDIPKKTAMKIVLKAGMGHQGAWTIPLEEIDPAAASPENDGASTIANSETLPSQGAEPGFTPPASAGHCLTQEEAKAIVAASLDKKMGPVLEKLNRLLDPHKGPTVSDIMGGIGYILGLVGLAAYFQARKEKK